MTTSRAKPKRKVAIAVDTPIAIRLLPEEHAKVKAVAQREQRSLASVCRLAVLRGLANYEEAGGLV